MHKPSEREKEETWQTASYVFFRIFSSSSAIRHHVGYGFTIIKDI
jgi:hypothetical protein